MVISPWVKNGPGSDGGYISHLMYSHASFIKLAETNWSLPNLGARDADPSIGNLMDFFDFNQTPKAPLILQKRTCPPMTEAQLRQVATEGD